MNIYNRFNKVYESIPDAVRHSQFDKWYRSYSMGIDRTYQATTKLLNIENANLARISPENSYDDMLYNSFAARELNVLPAVIRIALLRAGESLLYLNINGTEAKVDTDLTMCESSILEYNRILELA